MSMQLHKLVRVLVNFSERAANIARTIRADEELFSLLIEEKEALHKNDKVVQDFKTLADVLIQQTLCHIVQQQFPMLKGKVFGEESALFHNTAGAAVTIAVQPQQADTAALLSRVLDGNIAAAEALAKEVHRAGVVAPVTMIPPLPSPTLQESRDDVVPLHRLAIWIDPIDATAEYIRGHDSTGSPIRSSASITLTASSPNKLSMQSAAESARKSNNDGSLARDVEEGVVSVSHAIGVGKAVHGLPCVTVLVGVFDTLTGLPVAGVVNQPFAPAAISSQGGKSSVGLVGQEGAVFWGINYHHCAMNNLSQHGSTSTVVAGKSMRPRVYVSSSETREMCSAVERSTSGGGGTREVSGDGEFQCIVVSGAGYKCLGVIRGEADLYLCSKASTYMWDTCGPHAILLSQGGGVIAYEDLYKFACDPPPDHMKYQLRYRTAHSPDDIAATTTVTATATVTAIATTAATSITTAAATTTTTAGATTTAAAATTTTTEIAATTATAADAEHTTELVTATAVEGKCAPEDTTAYRNNRGVVAYSCPQMLARLARKLAINNTAGVQ